MIHKYFSHMNFFNDARDARTRVSLSLMIMLLVLIYCNGILGEDTQDSNKVEYDKFNEALFVKPLLDGKLYVEFKFKTTYRHDMKNLRWENRMQIFPLSIAELISSTDVNSLHFSLTRGNWNFRNWGYLFDLDPVGAHVRVTFSNFNKTPDKSWNKLINMLSGKFCASLGAADEMTVSNLKLSFQDHLNPDNATLGEKLYYLNLPEETLCTENLTPWKKLLPCYSNSGLASLLNAKYLMQSSFSSLSIDVAPKKCLDSNGDRNNVCERVELVQTVRVVYNPLNMFEGKQIWSFAKMFGNSIRDFCPLASSSRVYVDVTELDDMNKLYPQFFSEQLMNSKRHKNLLNRKYALFDVDKIINHQNETRTPLNIGLKQNRIFKYVPHSKRENLPINLHTNVAGIGSNSGAVVATITNSLDEPIPVIYMHVIPHFMRVYIHTISLRTRDGSLIEPDNINFEASKDNSPTSIEVSVSIPANSEVRVSFEFDRVFLRWTEYKPGANKGVLISPATLFIPDCTQCLKYLMNPLCLNSSTTVCNQKSWDDSFKVIARPLLVILPTPDFSMPYNVICLVCSVLVAGFGPIYNMTTRAPKIKLLKRGTADEDAEQQ